MTKTKKTQDKKARFNTRYLVLGIVGVVIIIAGILASYDYVYADKVLLNTYLQNKNLSSKTDTEVKEAINQIENNYSDKKLKIVYQDKKWEMPFSEVGWQLNRDETAKKILEYGHKERVEVRVAELLRSLFVRKDFSLEYNFDENAVLNWISQIDSEIGQSKKETNIVIKKGEAKVTDPEIGKKINDDEIKSEILDHLALNKSGDINAKIVDDNPIISADEAKGLIDRAKELTNHELKAIGPAGSFTLDSGDLGLLIQLKKEKKKKGFLKTELGQAYVSFDNEKIKSLLQKNLDDLNIEAVDAKFTISAGQISLISPSEKGEEVKVDESASAMVKALEEGKSEVKLPSKVQEPSIAASSSEDIQKIGVRELIGTATTDFKKSPQNRVHNIETGVKYISGAILKPGEEFSTVKRLGSIDQSGGYLPELVIKENETIPEFGGGLCQVSTTLFRAAMQSGLKITERHNHSYRVSYYEPPVGMDATIYSPRPDFKFINDTDSHILINGHIDGTKITFDIYGTKDGRQVEITDPTVYDITDPPEPIYKDDPSLEPGELRQTDKAHPGAKAVFYYRVKKNGQVSEEKFVSSYVPWPAKYLRGPQTEVSQPQ